MNITDVRVRCVAKEGKMKAVVSITIDEEFVVHDIKVIEGEKGLFIAMPSRKATAPREVFSHYRELEQIGLSAPQVTYLMHDLAKRGWPVDADATTAEEAADAIFRALKEKKSC